MIDTAKIIFYMTDKVFRLLSNPIKLSRIGCELYGNRFYFKHPYGYKNISVTINLQRRSLCVEASLPKLLQGHNLFGVNHVSMLCNAVIALIYAHLRIPYNQLESSVVEQKRIRLGRIDLACSFKLSSMAEIDAVLQAGWMHLRADGGAWSVYGCEQFETLYRQQRSTRVSDKFYNKHAELLDNPLPKDVPLRATLERHAKYLLRYEATIRAKELRRLGLEYADTWTPHLAIQILKQRLRSFNFTDELLSFNSVGDIVLANKRDQLFYDMWAQGCDLRRHRDYPPLRRARSDLKAMRIDIFRAPAQECPISLHSTFNLERAYFTGPTSLVKQGALFGAKLTSDKHH